MNTNIYSTAYCTAYYAAYGFYPEDEDIAAHEAKTPAGRAAELTWLRTEFHGPSPDEPEWFAQQAEDEADRAAILAENSEIEEGGF